MEFRQQCFAKHIFFNFGETELKYRVKDNSGDAEFVIAYRDIPLQKRIFFERNIWLRNVGVLWCVIGLVELVYAVLASRLTIFSSFWLPIGLGCLVFYQWTQRTYTAIDTNSGTVWIMKDKQHDEVLRRLLESRRDALLSWYRNIDFEGDAQREIQTIEWLIKQKVLTKEEGDGRIAAIRPEQRLLDSPIAAEPPRKLH